MLYTLLPLALASIAASATAATIPPTTTTTSSAVSVPTDPTAEFALTFSTWIRPNELLVTKAHAVNNRTSSPGSLHPSVVIVTDLTLSDWYTNSTQAFTSDANNGGKNFALNLDLTAADASAAPARGVYGLLVPGLGDKPWEPKTVVATLNARDLGWEYDSAGIGHGETQFYLCDDVVNGKNATVLKSGFPISFQGQPQAPGGCFVTRISSCNKPTCF